MEIKKLSIEQVREIYDTWFCEAFPADEIRPWSNLKGHWDAGRYECYGYFDEQDALCTYAFFFRSDDLLLLDYLASIPEKRSAGLGGVFLRALHERMKNDVMLAEVEAPVSGNEETDALRRRRIAFYERNGMVQEPLMSCVCGVTYRLMSSGTSDTHDALQAKAEQMYWDLLGEKLFREHVLVWQEPVLQGYRADV